jgi:hypothetical protein
MTAYRRTLERGKYIKFFEHGNGNVVSVLAVEIGRRVFMAFYRVQLIHNNYSLNSSLFKNKIFAKISEKQ